MRRYYQWLKRPWFWVLLGAIMTAGSALLSHDVVMENDHLIQSLKLRSEQIDQYIDNQWESINRLERDSNIAMLMATRLGEGQLPQGIEKGIKTYIRTVVEHGGDPGYTKAVHDALDSQTGSPEVIFSKLLAFVEKSRKKTVDTIDQAYLEKIGLQERIQALEQVNTSYSNMALFLQVMGLIFVLSKDLARRTWPA